MILTRRPRRGGAVYIAAAMGGPRVVGWLAVATSALVAVIAVLVIVAGFVSGADIRSAGDCGSEAHPEACTTEWEMGLTGSALLAVAAWGVAAGLGLRKDRDRARLSVVATQSLWAIGATVCFGLAGAGPEGFDPAAAVAGAIVAGTFLLIAAAAARRPAPA